MNDVILILRWAFGSVCLALSLLAVTGNYWLIVQWYVTKRRSSQIPFVGGIFGAIGIGVLPLAGVNKLWWIPLLIDPGCVPILALTAAYHLFHRRRFISNADAANIIFDFLGKVETDKYAWDMIGKLRNDFSAPDLDLALVLCSFYSQTQIRKHSENINLEEKNAYKIIARALSKGLLHFTNHKEMENEIRKGNIPVEIKAVFEEGKTMS